MCLPATGRDLRYHEAATLSQRAHGQGQQVGDPGPRWKEWPRAWKTRAARKIRRRQHRRLKESILGFPRSSVVEGPPANAGDVGSIADLGRAHMPRSNRARAPQPLSLCSGAREQRLPSPRAPAAEVQEP